MVSAAAIRSKPQSSTHTAAGVAASHTMLSATSTTTPSSSPSSTTAADVTRRMVCGGLAGMLAKTATNPLDRIRMLSQTGEHGGTHQLTAIQLYRRILQNEGILGLWAGNGANLLRVFPAKAVVFSSNDVYKSMLRQAAHMENDGRPLPGSLAFLAGGMSGMTASLLTYPLDLERGRITGKLADSNRAKQYHGILRTVALTVQDEGIRGIFRGVTPTLLGAMPYEGIKFGTVGVLEIVFPNHGESNPLRKMLFGGMGGVMAGLITYPNDTVRRMLQLQGSRGTDAVYTGYWNCARSLYRQHGIRRFYNGLTINIIRMAPNTAVQFGSYELLKKLTADMF